MYSNKILVAALLSLRKFWVGGGFLLILSLISTLASTVIFSTKRCPICCVIYLLLGNKIPQNLVGYCSRFPGCQFGWDSAKQVYCRSHLRSFIRVPSHLIDCLRWIHRSGSWCWLALSTHSLILKETSPDFFTRNSQAARETSSNAQELFESTNVMCANVPWAKASLMVKPLFKESSKHTPALEERSRKFP